MASGPGRIAERVGEDNVPSPRFSLACCLCEGAIGRRGDVFALDAEWQRRFPRMIGVIACQTCALRKNYWRCQVVGYDYVEGHIPVPGGRPDFDSWNHVQEFGTQIAVVHTYPESGLRQGAEEYLRYTARRRGLDTDVARRLQAAIEAWDALSRP